MNPSIGVDLRLKWTNRVISFFLALGILVSLNLWLSTRLFPLSPVFRNLEITAPFDGILIGVLLFALVVNFLTARRFIIWFIVALLIFILSLDQMRWQPWVYVYFLLITPFAFRKDSDSNYLVINAIQLVLPGIYVWSGLHKLNPNFAGYAKNIIREAINVDSSISGFIGTTVQLIPYFEIVVGLALFVPRTRSFGVLGAIVIHLTIFVLVGPIGANINSIIWPWNVAMICLVTLAFFRARNKVIVFPIDNLKFRILNSILVMLVWAMPSLNFFNLWDNYLAFSLYSGKVNEFYVAVKQNELFKIDKRLHKYFVTNDGLNGGELIDVQRWSMAELNVPFTGQKRVFNQVCKFFCPLNIQNDDLVFLEISKNVVEVAVSSTTCEDLNDH